MAHSILANENLRSLDFEEKKLPLEPVRPEKTFEYDGCTIVLRYEIKPVGRSDSLDSQGETSSTPKEGLPSRSPTKVEDVLVMDLIHISTQRRWRYTFLPVDLPTKFPGITSLRSIEKMFELLVSQHQDVRLKWTHSPNNRADLDGFNTLGMIVTVTTLLEENEIRITLEKVAEEFEMIMNRVVLNLEEKVNNMAVEGAHTKRSLIRLEHNFHEAVGTLDQRVGDLEEKSRDNIHVESEGMRPCDLMRKIESLTQKFEDLSRRYDDLSGRVIVSKN